MVYREKGESPFFVTARSITHRSWVFEMRVSRLYVQEGLGKNRTVELNDDAAHYVRTVLRLKKDSSLIVFDGKGGEYTAVVAEASKKRVALDLGQWHDRKIESNLTINLGLAISRGDKMDWAVQKAVELGVNRITPLVTERCVVQLKGEKQQQRLMHWQKIVQHAAEQCGRTVLPALSPIDDLTDWVDKQPGLRIFLDPYAETSLSQLKPLNDQVTLLSGPEGGFADHERDMAKAEGFIPVRLGARVLRTETAALASIASLQMLWGDFGSSTQS